MRQQSWRAPRCQVGTLEAAYSFKHCSAACSCRGKAAVPLSLTHVTCAAVLVRIRRSVARPDPEQLYRLSSSQHASYHGRIHRSAPLFNSAGAHPVLGGNLEQLRVLLLFQYACNHSRMMHHPSPVQSWRASGARWHGPTWSSCMRSRTSWTRASRAWARSRQARCAVLRCAALRWVALWRARRQDHRTHGQDRGEHAVLRCAAPSHRLPRPWPHQ